MKKIAIIIYSVVAMLSLQAQPLSQKYDKAHPLIIVGDWDKPPYEFLNDQGKPAGTNIDLMNALCQELGISCKFVLKEWSGALKTFERQDADIILANVRRYQHEPYVCTENIINFNRICAASVGDSAGIISTNTLTEEGVVLKPGDYTTLFFKNLDSLSRAKVEYQSPKVALQGLLAGDYKYFVWGEEPLKWKIKELNLNGITLNDVSIPVSEIHIIGRDKELIYRLDDVFSRMKQRGEVQSINDKWMHPERIQDSSTNWMLYAILGALVLFAILYALSRIAKAHVRNATHNSSDLNNMMYKALHMGNFHVMVYDIRRDLMTNGYGQPILPENGITLKEFTEHIHPNEVEEFTRKMNNLLSGRKRKFELNKRWRAFGDDPHWLNLEGHAMVELDSEGQPAYVINAVSDVTQNIEEDHAARDLVCKYEKLSNMPFVAMSFYDKDGWLIDLNDAMRKVCGITPENPESERFWLTVCMFDIPMFRSAYSPNDKDPLQACMHMEYPDMGLNRYVEYHVRPLINDQGEIANYFVSTVDITDDHDFDHELHLYEQDIRSTQQRIDRYDQWLNFLTKQGLTYLWYSDISQQTAYYYRSMMGKEPEDFIVMPFERHCSHMLEEERQTAMDNYNSHQAFDSVLHFVNTVLDSGESWFHITGTPITDAEGHVTGHRGLSIDITREMSTKKRLEKEARIAQDIGRLKSGFMASMTHELRTPLNAIIGFTEVLPFTDAAEERDEYIRIIRKNCDMLQRLINDILTASSLNEGPTSIRAEEVEFSSAFDDICLTLQQRMQDGVQFIKHNPYDTFYTTIDLERITQVITNFVTNAVKFTHQGYIKLGYHYERHGLRIFCEDSGTGIPQDKQDIVFDRFVKLDEFVQGTGMGLNICKSIAERMGGEIGVSSEGEGKGSIFWFWIPCERKLQTVNSKP
ncbi:MAG: transporter substrate-binding domain-containing protein [Prevotella sp.]|nr:transporter substrate-binding domain-containing protein [Prevotella sp.]